MDPETKAAHTEKAQHSTGLSLTSLWDSLRSRPPEVGPGCMRVPIQMSECMCVSLSRWLLCKGVAAAIKTHTHKAYTIIIYLSIYLPYIYINICISMLLSDSPASLRFEIRHLAETLLRADGNVRLVWFEKT